MNESRISVRYSRAIFESAVEKKILDKVNQDMILIVEVCRNPDIVEFLESPIIIPSKKIEIFHILFGSNIQDLTMKLIDLVVRHGRERYLPAIARVFIHETMEYNGITECILTTAVDVDPKIRKEISDLIAGLFRTKVNLKEKIDKSMIGGYILKVSDNYIDASVRNKLRKIRKVLTASSTGYGL
jgi:F-type H+-transporting ATPase subunit delta